MRRFTPDVADEPLEGVYRDLVIPAGGPQRPHVFLGMVMSADGAASVGDLTAGLGGDADRVAFRRLREHADAILVGAGTVRAEGYGPVVRRDDAAARRMARGAPPVARLVVVSGRVDLDPGARLFADPSNRPLLLVPRDAPGDRLAALAGVAEIVVAGDGGEVDLPAALRELADRGVSRLLCEGGPRLNGRLLVAGLVDELFLTVAPMLVGGPAQRIVTGAVAPGAQALELVEGRHHGGELLLRYRVVNGSPGT